MFCFIDRLKISRRELVELELDVFTFHYEDSGKLYLHIYSYVYRFHQVVGFYCRKREVLYFDWFLC